MSTIERQVDNIDQSDLLKPEIKLVQSTGGEKAKAAGAMPGQLFNVATGEVYPDGFEFVILDIPKGRTYWGRETLGDDPPVCSSNNAKSYESVNGEDCRKCPHMLDNAASVDAKTRREKCCPNFTILGVMLETLTPFQLRATGISATPVASLLTQIMYNPATHNTENPQLIDWHKFKLSVKGVEQKTKNGNAYALHFGNISLFGDLQLEGQMFNISAMLLGQGSALTAIPEKATQDKETQTITSKDVGKMPASITKPAQAPKVNNVTPPAKQTPPAAAPKTTKPKMDMEI